MSKIAHGRPWDNIATAIIALVLAVIIWVNAIYETDPPVEDTFPEPIPIEVVNLEEGLAITSMPAGQVRVRIKAFQSSWETLTRDSFRAIVDLEGLGEGLHTVPIEVTCTNRTVTVLATQPDSVYVRLETADERTMEITVRVENEDSLPLGYVAGEPRIRPTSARISGPRSLVASVQALVVSVDLSDKKKSIDTQIEIQPVDANGNVVSGVQVDPPKVDLLLNIEQRQNYREVAVLAQAVGQPARGYYISSLQVTPPTITVVGPPEIISAMPGVVKIKEPIDVTGATRMITEWAELDLPEGVSAYYEGGVEGQVLVTVGIDPITGGSTIEVPLKSRRLKEGYTVSLSVPSVDVILTGPSVVLDALTVDLVDAYVDLSGLEAGTHQVEVIVELRVDQNPQLADLVVTSISPAFVEAVIEPLRTTTP